MVWGGALGTLLACSTVLRNDWSLVRFPIRSLICFNLPNSSRCTMALQFTQLLTEVGLRNIPGGDEARMARKAADLTAICWPIV
jgi:hypothetical protein